MHQQRMTDMALNAVCLSEMYADHDYWSPNKTLKVILKEGKIIRVKSTEKLLVKTEISSLHLVSCNRAWACTGGNLCVSTPSVLKECNLS